MTTKYYDKNDNVIFYYIHANGIGFNWIVDGPKLFSVYPNAERCVIECKTRKAEILRDGTKILINKKYERI